MRSGGRHPVAFVAVTHVADRTRMRRERVVGIHRVAIHSVPLRGITRTDPFGGGRPVLHSYGHPVEGAADEPGDIGSHTLTFPFGPHRPARRSVDQTGPVGLPLADCPKEASP